jgi:hypothetical protein
VDNPSPHSLSRRGLIRNGLLVGLGATAALGALPGLTGTARATDYPGQIAIYIEDHFSDLEWYSCQEGWWYCLKCLGMYHSDNDTPGGVCPAGGQHQNDTNYDQYNIPHDGPSQSYGAAGGVQVGWRWCRKCQGLFWGGAQAESVCPAGGLHVITSGTDVYDAPYGQAEFFQQDETDYFLFPGQSGWEYCGLCRGLFYGNGLDFAGICPAGGNHVQYGSTNYCMMLDSPTLSNSP